MAERSTRDFIQEALRNHIAQQRRAKRPVAIFQLNSRGETPVEEALRVERESEEGKQ